MLISSLDMRAMSLAVVTWVGESVRPQQSSKWVLVMPSPAALSFIIFTNSSSVPAMYSAMATEASFPEATTMHLIMVSTVWVSPSSRKTWEPPMDLACALVTTSSVIFIFPESRASKIRTRVMIFVMLAGLLFVSASFSYITCPVEASISRALGACMDGPPSAFTVFASSDRITMSDATAMSGSCPHAA